MALRSSPVEAAERQLESARQRLKETSDAAAAEEAALAAAIASREAAAAEPERFAAVEQAVARHRGELKRLRLLIPQHEPAVEEAERAVRLVRFDEARAAIPPAVEASIRASRDYGKALRALADAQTRLYEARLAAAVAIHQADELAPEDLDWDYELVDEPDWGISEKGLEAIARFMKEGPKTPASDADRKERDQRQRDNEVIRLAISQEAFVRANWAAAKALDGPQGIAALPEHLGERARERFEREVADARRARDEARGRSLIRLSS